MLWKKHVWPPKNSTASLKNSTDVSAPSTHFLIAMIKLILSTGRTDCEDRPRFDRVRRRRSRPCWGARCWCCSWCGDGWVIVSCPTRLSYFNIPKTEKCSIAMYQVSDSTLLYVPVSYVGMLLRWSTQRANDNSYKDHLEGQLTGRVRKCLKLWAGLRI